MPPTLCRNLPDTTAAQAKQASAGRAPADLARPAPGIAPSSGELTNLQLLRALAASLVLVHHVAVYGHSLRGTPRPPGDFDGMMGVWGVAIFFALSGFLMARLVTRDPPALFLAHRVSRIFPTYFAVVALFGGLFAALGLEFGGLSVLSLSLVPAGQRSYPLNVEWTLTLEVSFYVGLFLLAGAGLARRLVPLAVGWLVLLAVAFPLLPPDSRNLMPPPVYLLPVTAACVPFAGGLLLPRLLATGRIGPRSALLVLPFAAACLLVDTAFARGLGGIAAVLLVGAAVAAPQIRRQGPASRGLIALGDWSYVLYLVHPPVLMLANRLCSPDWSGLAYGMACIAGALAATALLGPLDVAAYRRLRGWIDRRGQEAMRRPAIGFLAVFAALTAWGSAETARNDWVEAKARRALDALPAGTWTSPRKAETVVAGRDLALPATLRAAVETVERISPNELLVSAYAFDPARPGRAMQFALFCGGRLVALEKPRRMRRDLAGQAGFEAVGKRRIGYRVRIPTGTCAPQDAVAVVIDGDGRMAVLPPPPGTP